MGFRKWAVSILSTTQVSQNVILLALMFIYRLKKLNPGVKGKLGSEFRLFTVALMLGNKFLDDNTYTNKTWAEVSGISVQEIHIMEVEFLSNMRYTLYASENEWKAWHVKLGKFWKYFEAASKSPVEAAPKILNPPVPSPHGPPNLPSPPASTHTSPPYISSHSFSTTAPAHPHPLSMPPYLPLTGASTLGPLSEPGLKSTSRKRNCDQVAESVEPPTKRQVHSATPSGDDNTFGAFPEHLRALVSHALPKINVKAVTYPKFDTRGDLGDCVIRFREWLQNIVIDLEVSAGTPSPTIDPSVRTILVGHSMGGIVAAETLLHIISDEPIPPSSSKYASSDTPAPSSAAHTTLSSTSTSIPNPRNLDEASNTFIFPYIQGILAFDTPYLGLSPSLIAHGAESHYRSASSAYSALTDLAGVFGYGASTNPSPNAKQQAKVKAGALPPPAPEHAKDGLSASMTAASQDAAATPTWQRLGRYAMFAGAAGAVAAGGAAAYLKADTLSSGWNWVGSHLEFVGCLVRGEELKSRLDRVITLEKERGIGFADLFTVLGRGADKGGMGTGGEKRTFCNIPKTRKWREGYWFPEINEKAKEETGAHMSMFAPKENPGYYG
ncbi:MAG: hypothetical protein Q9201_007448, partial [Fulgogasparrea decipioides]